MSLKLRDFTASPSQELLDLAKKSDLLDIADHFGLPNIKKTMLKHDFKNIPIQFFVDEEIFDSSTTSQILVTQTDLQLRELEIKRQVKILRDAGASQSLILADTQPFSEKTSSGTSVLIQGVECGFINVPLHNIYLSSDLVTGLVVVGIYLEVSKSV